MDAPLSRGHPRKKGKEMSDSFVSIDTDEEEDCNCWEEFGELCQSCSDYVEDMLTEQQISYYQEQRHGII
jgi:hypothetical protein